MYISDTCPGSILDAVLELEPGPSDAAVLFLDEHGTTDIGAVIDELNRRSIKCMGGVFPGVLFGGRKYDYGAVVCLSPIAGDTFFMAPGRSSVPEFVENALRKGIGGTIFTLLDGCCREFPELLYDMHRLTGGRAGYIGGGAGALSPFRRSRVFCNEGVFENALVAGLFPLDCDIASGHGWRSASPRMRVTASRGNALIEIDGTNALDMYRQFVESRSFPGMDEVSFYRTANEYPIAIERDDGIELLRVPFSHTSEGAILCVGDFPESCDIRFMEGNACSVVDAAAGAAEACRDAAVGMERRYIVIECVTRFSYLGERFKEELSMVTRTLRDGSENGGPCGFMSIGSILGRPGGRPELSNKNLVIGGFYEGDGPL